MREFSPRLGEAFLLCIGSVALFAYIALAISNETISNFDNTIISFVQGLEAPWLTAVMKTFTWIGSTKIVLVISLFAFGLLTFIRHRAQAFLLFAVITGIGLLNTVLKFTFKRQRPESHQIIDVDGFSFPSTHAMLAFGLYVITAFIAWGSVKTSLNQVLLFLFAAFMIGMIGTSRIYLGAHYPSDIVGGIAASSFWVIISTSVYIWFQNRREKKITH